ncbi:hypothetical protein MLS218_06230 [Helicobacter pylori]
MLFDQTLTCISLFSGAGVGCYGLLEEGLDCDKQALITFENNHKNATGVCGDIKKLETKEKILKQIEFSS